MTMTQKTTVCFDFHLLEISFVESIHKIILPGYKFRVQGLHL